MILQILVSAFVLFAISRVWLRFRDGSISMWAMLFWTMLWVGVASIVWWPSFTSKLADLIGVGRGADAIVYISIIILFYGVFRLYVKLEFIEREITSLVRKLTLRQGNHKQ